MNSRHSATRNACRNPFGESFSQRLFATGAALLCLASASLAQPGGKTIVNPDDARRGKDVFAPKPGGKTDGKPAGKQGAAGERSWTILIVAYQDDPDLAAANTALERVRGEGGLADAYAELRGKNSVVCVGKYADPASDQAKRDLERVRAIPWKGVKPFAGALLMPPDPEAMTGSIPELDLRTVKQRLGKDAAYTLQVAHYTRPDRKAPSDKELREFREAAEKAAAVLRRDGEEAFYCHLSQSSVVTIGVLTDEDYVATSTSERGTVKTIKPKESPKLQAIRQRFPRLLINGQGAKARTTGMDKAQDLRPIVVEIPGPGDP